MNLYGGSVTLNAELANSNGEIRAATTAMAESSEESVTTVALTNSSQKPIGWIGVHAQNKGDVAVVTNVTADSPGAKAGIQVGDIILAIDGRLLKGKDFETTVAALKTRNASLRQLRPWILGSSGVDDRRLAELRIYRFVSVR